MMKREIFVCECHSLEHQIVLFYSEDESIPICYVEVHLAKKSFWKRLKYGIKYIFGYQCRYGAFDEFIFNPQDADKLQDVVNYLKNSK